MKKLNVGSANIQEVFSKHVEKIIFGVCLVLVVLFVFLGLRLKAYEMEPTEMEQLVKSARSNIEKNSWDALQSQPERIRNANYTAAGQAGKQRTPGELYVFEKPLSPLVNRPMVKRNDPELFAPLDLEVRSVYAPIAVKDEGRVQDRLASLETVKVERPRERNTGDRSRGSSSSRGSARQGGVPGSLGGGGAGGGPTGGGGAIPFAPGGAMTSEDGDSSGPEMPKILRNPAGWRPGGMVGGGGGAGMGGMGGMTGMTGMMGGAMPGMGAPQSARGGPGAGSQPAEGSESESSAPAAAAEKVTFQPAHFVVILARVPNEKQLDAFRLTLENAIGYNPSVDRPVYLAFRVERAEVGADPNAPLEWVAVGSTKKALDLSKQWAGQHPEVAHPAYTDPALTMPVPPVLLKDIRELVNHSKIPLASEQLPTNMAPTTAAPTTTSEENTDGDLPGGDIPTAGQFQNPGAPAAAGGGPGAMMGNMPGSAGGAAGGGRGGASGMPGSGMAGSGAGMQGAPPSSMMGGSMGGAMGSGMGGGMGGMGGSMMMGSAAATDYKLLRYFDFTAEPGKVYRYRVQLYLEDPNHPGNRVIQTQMLAEEAAARVSKLKAGVNYRLTDYSAESASISLPPAESFYAGSTVRGRLATHDESGAQVHQDPLEMKFAAVYWDEQLGVEVSSTASAFVGSVLNVKGNIEVVHPITLEFKLLKNYHLRAKGVIADVRGGEKVAIDEKNEALFQPIEYAAVDADGNLVVHNEIDDLEEYRRYAFVELEEEPDSGGSGAAGMMPGGGGGTGAAGGMMGSGGGGMGMMPGSMGGQGKGGGRGNRKGR